MFSTLIVARMDPAHSLPVADLFGRFDGTEMPYLMGTRRRELFRFHNLYFHLQDFAGENGEHVVEDAKTDPRFIQVSADLRPYIEPFAPDWRSPKDAMAERFYHWEASS
ncbi:TcmI family type II polyketide cyclase [Kineosporia rhizophila]|uniref:TcmI family type II polyketide cyclase n=1 Tax=Kineosporia TaxID=49184 RepID=UPI000A957E04|nr:TcmI family type II polyketide cyclase [Kineosporia sp. NBRC 101677]MCE0537631.1 TcmI family type II polyketide cyclase [Kineosporia rhizophila]GLY18854.1 polyketide synthase [Kineosporia sp. NBRC 101677]